MHRGLCVFVFICSCGCKMQKAYWWGVELNKKPKQTYFLHSSHNGERLLSLQALFSTAPEAIVWYESRCSVQLSWQVCLFNCGFRTGIISSKLGGYHCREKEDWAGMAVCSHPTKDFEYQPTGPGLSLQCRQQTERRTLFPGTCASRQQYFVLKEVYIKWRILSLSQVLEW